ncbi:MAG: hypothetical protein AAFR74_01010 [Pseudomonadota bacterium]
MTALQSGIRPHEPLQESAPKSQRAFAQDEVTGFLERSKSFAALPPDEQDQVIHDTRKVVGFIADAGGSPMLERAIGAKALQAHANKSGGGGSLGRAFENPDDSKSDADYARDGGQALADVVEAIDFPGFVAELVEGVFQAVVDASIQQMEAFAELVANVSKSVDAFMKDNISEDQARDYLAGQYPDHLQPDLEAGRLKPRPEADQDNAPNFLQDLGLPFELGDLGDEETEKELVTAGRKKMAMDRQQMLATMVLMGLNRIVVTDGQIRASVVFNLNTKALQEENEARSNSFEYGRTTDRTSTRDTKRRAGFFSRKPKVTTSSKLNVKTDTKYNSDSSSSEERTRETELKAKLTGNVDLRFKSETFPLERMTELMGTNTAAISQAARQTPPSRSASDTPEVPIPPPPPI